MIKIRRNVFETNSSSTHSITIEILSTSIPNKIIVLTINSFDC